MIEHLWVYAQQWYLDRSWCRMIQIPKKLPYLFPKWLNKLALQEIVDMLPKMAISYDQTSLTAEELEHQPCHTTFNLQSILYSKLFSSAPSRKIMIPKLINYANLSLA